MRCSGFSTRLMAGAILAAAGQAPAAPTLVDNVYGYTLTGTGLAQFGALAFENGKVLATGEARDLRTRFPSAQVVDGHGATLLPGIIDAHGHILSMGAAMTAIDLVGNTSLA